MKCVYVQPLKQPEIVDIPNTLEDLQKAVGGYIEVVYPFYDDVGLVCNEEGKLMGLCPSAPLRDSNGNIYDLICGPFLVVGLSEDDFCDLSDELAEKYLNLYATDDTVRIICEEADNMGLSLGNP